MPATTDKKYTVEEYFELEKTSPVRHEFVHGSLIPMTGESKKAKKIAANCLRMLADPLEEKGFEVFVHDVRLSVEERALYRYPELVVAPETDEEDTHAVFELSLALKDIYKKIKL
jgi:Uma2 family endonuclease